MSTKINARDCGTLLERMLSEIHSSYLYVCKITFAVDKRHSCMHLKTFFFPFFFFLNFLNSQLFKFLFFLCTISLSVLSHLLSNFFCISVCCSFPFFILIDVVSVNTLTPY